MFLRGLPHLCHKMRRLTSKDVAKRRETAEALGEDAEFTPDFYEMSRRNPLPENPAMANSSLFGANPALLGALNPGLAGIHPALLASNPALLQALEATLIERQNQQRAELIQRLSALEAQQQSNPNLSPQLAQLLRGTSGDPSMQNAALASLLRQQQQQGQAGVPNLGGLGGQGGQGSSGDPSMQNAVLASLLRQQQQQQGQAGLPNVGGLASLRNSLGGGNLSSVSGAAGIPQSALSSNQAGASAAPASGLAARSSAGGNPDLSMLLALQTQQQGGAGFGGFSGGMYGGGM
jgi:hypothetical protein